MDITQWLQETAGRAPPDRSDEINIPDFLRPHHRAGDKPSRSYRRKRKRASSDSSVIAPKLINHLHNKATTRSLSPAHIRNAHDTATVSQHSQHSQSHRIAQGHAPTKTYEKRARHKTKADRYEPKVKKPRKERDSKHDSKSNQKRRKSHRSGDGERTMGLVQSFQLKEGPKKNRLTVSIHQRRSCLSLTWLQLKPEANAGLFKHGRASVQMTGRRTGRA